MIDTDNIQKSWNQARGCIKRFVCKMSVNQLATGRYMRRMKYWASDKCPRCLQSNKTTLHVIQCNHLSATQRSAHLRDQLVQQLSAFPTCRALVQLITVLLQAIAWQIEPHLPSHHEAQPLLQAQMQLPLHEFARGRIVHQWKEYQQQYLTAIQSPQNANRWAQTLITGLWNIYFHMWLHRNKAFHSNKQVQDKLHKLHLIDHEIRRQWNIGPQELHSADKKHFQNITLAQLLRKTRHYKQTWLQRVKSARSAIHTEEEDD